MHSIHAEDYEDESAKDMRIDLLREKIRVVENPSFSKDYLDPEKRSIANAVTIHFKDGSSTERFVVEYPLGHRRRRQEAHPLILKKFENNLLTHYSRKQTDLINSLFTNPQTLDPLPVNKLVEILAIS